MSATRIMYLFFFFYFKFTLIYYTLFSEHLSNYERICPFFFFGKTWQHLTLQTVLHIVYKTFLGDRIINRRLWPPAPDHILCDCFLWAMLRDKVKVKVTP